MSTNPHVIIYFDIEEYFAFKEQDHYYASFCRFAEYALSRGIEVSVVVGNDTYLGNMKFSGGYLFNNGTFSPVTSPIQGDVIYIKGKQHTLSSGADDLIVCDPRLESLDDDKLAMYEKLHDFMAPTFAINDKNWEEVFEKITTSKIVLKPICGNSGEGVTIGEKSQYNFPELNTTEPYIAQEYVDSSMGLPGLSEGSHDLRLVLFNGQIKLAFIRTAKPGSFIANLSKGGTNRILSLDQVPVQAIEAAKKIDEILSGYYPRVYSTDFMFENGRPILSEINTGPSFPEPGLHTPEYITNFDKYLLDELVRVWEESKN